ncbi:MAG: hypothetical protein HFF50_09180 [Lawsonibacter sp.]|nr:hypothetical protein [Lawsonibacter sp.]
MVLFVWYVGDAVAQGQKETVLQGFFTNDIYDCFPARQLQKDFSAHLGLEKGQRVIFDDDLFLDMNGEAVQYTAASNGKVIAYMAVGELDFVVTTQEVYEHFVGQIPMRDLSALLPPDLYARLSPCIALAEGTEGTDVPAAIEMSQCRFLQGADLEGERYYLFVPYNAPHDQAICAFIRYCFP